MLILHCEIIRNKIRLITVYEFINHSKLPAYHIGRKLRIEGADLDLFMKDTKGQFTGRMLDVLRRHLEKQMPHVRLLRSYNGSMDVLKTLDRDTALNYAIPVN